MPLHKQPLTLTEFARLGGKARMAKLNKQQRIELARKAGSTPKRARMKLLKNKRDK